MAWEVAREGGVVRSIAPVRRDARRRPIRKSWLRRVRELWHRSTIAPMPSADSWTTDRIPDLSGKTFIITGANSGLGLETTRAVVAKGARVVMACRDSAKAEAARAQVAVGVAASSVSVMELDLASLESVRAFAEAVLSAHDRLDVLVNNAGVMAIPRRTTADGFEMQFGTNHLGHFALTGLLLRRLLGTPGSRIVNLSSNAHKFGKMNFDDLNWEKGYGKWRVYGQSKLSNLLFTYELARRAKDAGKDITVAASHPGYANTNLQFVGPQMEQSGLQERIVKWGNNWLSQSAAMGALPSLRAATDPGVASGDYFGPDRMFEQQGHPVKVDSTARSHDRDAQRRLWEYSAQATGVGYEALLG